MSALSVQGPFPIITDTDGQPLEDGSIYIGVVNLNAITNPQTVYWDAALTQVATQPIRTRGGYPLNGAAPGRLYVANEYSIAVVNRIGAVVYTAPSPTERYSSSLLTFLQAGANAVPRSVQSKLRDVVSVKDFGAVGDGVTDDTAAIQAAIDGISNGDVCFPSGKYIISAPLKIRRGIRLLGEGQWNDTNSPIASTVFLKDGSNCAMVQTPVADGTGSATHYMAIENLAFHGNGLNQTLEATLIQFYGAFVGSYIKCVAIFDAYGTALAFDQGSDVKVEHVWIVGAISPSGKYALDSNATTGTAGLMNIDHLYVENSSNKKNGDPRLVQADRGNAIRFKGFVTLNVNELHLEGCRRAVDMTGVLTTRINNISASFVGLDADGDAALIRLLTNCPNIMLGTMTVFDSSSGYALVKKSFSSDYVPDMPLIDAFGQGYTSLSDPNYGYVRQAPTLFSNVGGVFRPGSANPVYWKVFGKTDGSLVSYGYIKQENAVTAIGSNYDQPLNTEKDFIKLYSAAFPTQNYIQITDPVLLPTRNTAQDIAVGSIWVATASFEGGFGPVYQRVAGNNGGGDMICTARRGAGVPAINANYIGEIWVDVTTSPRDAYIAISVGSGASDWKKIT